MTISKVINFEHNILKISRYVIVLKYFHSHNKKVSILNNTINNNLYQGVTISLPFSSKLFANFWHAYFHPAGHISIKIN